MYEFPIFIHLSKTDENLHREVHNLDIQRQS